MNKLKIIDFAQPFYEKKDIMHGISHIHRIYKKALEISKKYRDEVDMDVIFCACYFHGIIYSNEIDILQFLNDLELSINKISKIISAAKESHIDSTPNSLEGKIVHDAHLLEGDRNFIITKCLVTGSIRGQTLEQTIQYIEKNLLTKGNCVLDENKEEYKSRLACTREYINGLKSGLEE